MIAYVYNARDFAGRIWWPDIETQLEVSVSEAPDFEVSVDAVWADLYPHGRVDLIGKEATPLMRLLGMEIVEEAESDDRVISEAYEQEEIVYRGLPNCPDSRLVRVSS